jgi:predicted fused transcriptional regulator/phosphomethylpyrimidine kinase
VVTKVSEKTPASTSKTLQITVTAHNPSIRCIANLKNKSEVLDDRDSFGLTKETRTSESKVQRQFDGRNLRKTDNENIK